MNEKNPLLVVTPEHYATESLLGYVLRLSERNGYDTPWHVMSIAGLPQGKMKSAGFPTDKLVAVLGRSASELDGISYQSILADGEREFRLLGHSLGQGLSYAPLRLSSPQVCPRCASEQSYLDAFWDLTLAVACPTHASALLDTCHECGKRLTWFRPGISTCKCGANLAEASTKPVSSELAVLMRLIQAKLHGRSFYAGDNLAGFPVQELSQLSLRSMLILIDTLAHHDASREHGAARNPMEAVQSAIHILHDWPNGYYAFLRRAAQRTAGQKRAVGLRKRFESLYGALFKRHRPLDGVAFMRQEFIKFGLEEWGESTIDNKLLRGEHVQRRFVSLSEHAKRMGVRPITLRRWRDDGAPRRVVGTGIQTRYIVDSGMAMLGKAGGLVLGEREAAAFIGLPVSVLKALRQSGHYEVRHVVTPRKAFHEADLNSFASKLLALVGEATETPIPPKSMTLSEAMKLRFGNVTGKADFLRDVLAGKIEAIGRRANDARDIVFRRGDVEKFARSRRVSAANETWPLQEAARYLKCDYGIIVALIEDKALEVVYSRSCARVTERSVKNFGAKFVAIATLAKDIGSTPRRVAAALESARIPMKRFERKSGNAGAKLFVCRDYERQIAGALERPKANSRKNQSDSCMRLHAFDKLKQYLETLTAGGISLPRRGSKPNLHAIATACGFDRSAFYNNRNVAVLLDTYEYQQKLQR